MKPKKPVAHLIAAKVKSGKTIYQIAGSGAVILDK